MLILRAADVYAPQPLGLRDLIVGGGKILAITPPGEVQVGGMPVRTVECRGLVAMPGFIDGHVHVAGAGGEGGPATRTPEVTVSQLVRGGITSVVGCLGTDGYTRSPASVLMKVKSLRAQGLSAWMLTGAYQLPCPTLMGDVAKDIAMVEEVIGVGEVAVSDHRASWVSPELLVDLASKARVGGMLGGKAGIVQLHMGDVRNPLEPVYAAVERSAIPLSQFMATHMNRNRWILNDAYEFGRRGGWIDITTSSYRYFPQDETKPSSALRMLLAGGVPPDRITFSSDGNGSLPLFDESGALVRLEVGQPSSVFEEVRDAVVQEGLPVEAALSVATRNPARAYRLEGKGVLEVGADADVVLVDRDWRLTHVLARGQFMMEDGVGKPGTFEA